MIWTYLNWRFKWTRSEKNDDTRGALVIFIDDLDRCPKFRIVKVLETVKLFMDHPGCIFVIGAARDIIVKALAKDYGEQDAHRFMEKIVQVTFNTRESGQGGTSRADRYADGVSPAGCYDMAGNVWEWTADFYSAGKDRYIVKGGSWNYPAERALCAERSDFHPTYRTRNVGLRCARTNI